MSLDFDFTEELDGDYFTFEHQMAEVPPEIARKTWQESLKILRAPFKAKWVPATDGRRYLVINPGNDWHENYNRGTRPRSTRFDWPEEDIVTLRELYPLNGAKGMMPIYKGKYRYDDILKQASRLGIRLAVHKGRRRVKA